jgi:flagellar motility protein MotE (MotC chaperone)
MAWTVAIFALALAPAETGVTSPAASGPEEKPVETEAAPAAAGPTLDDLRETARLLQQRGEELDQREAAVREEEKRVAVLKSEVEGLLDRYEQKLKAQESAQRAKVDAAAKAAAEARKAKVAQMVKIYESMPVEEASARLDKLPADLALELLRAMKDKTAGAILAQVNPAKAALLSQQFLAKK